MMTKTLRMLVRLGRDDRGQDMIEYALMAAAVALAGGVFFQTTISPGISTIFSKLGSVFNAS